MRRIGHKRARDLILKWEFAGLTENEFRALTGHDFHTAIALPWDALDQALSHIEAVYRVRGREHSGSASGDGDGHL